MLNTIISIYITTAPLTIAGIVNAVFIRRVNLPALMRPIDNYITLPDGQRLFGDNKTWLGFSGYVFFSILFSLVWGILCVIFPYLAAHNYFYDFHPNTVDYSILIGFSLGAAYALFELPNSFLKRRFKIIPGKQSAHGWYKYFFAVFDHLDSAFGTILVVGLAHPLTWRFTILYLLLSGLTHWLLVKLLYFAKFRSQSS